MTKPLLVLLDVRMPDMDGRECAFQIQQLVKQRLGALKLKPKGPLRPFDGQKWSLKACFRPVLACFKAS